MSIVKILLAIFLPPVGVFMTYGLSTTLLINVLLTILGWIPGSIHALWAVTRQMEINRRSI